jgi:hypothetical protein
LFCGEAGEGKSMSSGMRAQPTVDDDVFTGISIFTQSFYNCTGSELEVKVKNRSK